MQLRISGMILMACWLVAGCASGSKFSAIQDKLPALAQNDGRVFFYRFPLWAGSAIQPDVLVDDNGIGKAVPGGVYFVDLAAGAHTISCEKTTVQMNLAAGQARYVSLENYTSPTDVLWRVRPVLVDPEQGRQEIQNLSYVGKDGSLH